MPTDSWRNDLVEAFSRFDSDDNGLIDQAEFNSLLDALGSTLNAKDREVGFALIDSDDDKTITLAELSQWWEIVRAEGSGQAPKE